MSLQAAISSLFPSQSYQHILVSLLYMQLYNIIRGFKILINLILFYMTYGVCYYNYPLYIHITIMSSSTAQLSLNDHNRNLSLSS